MMPPARSGSLSGMIIPDPPGFSVIIPTYQRRASLERVLDGLTAQAYPRPLIDVLVICDGSTDGSAEMVRSRRYPFRVRVSEQPNRGPAAARNLGLELARGPLVLFLDDDVVPAPCLLAEHATAHAEASNLVVVGPLLAPVGRRSAWVSWESETLEQQYQAMYAGEWSPTARQFYTGNASVRLEHLRRAGGFDTRFRRGEDVELGFRLQKLGLRFVFQRAAAASHIAERPFRSWLHAAYEYGRSDVLLGRALTGGDIPYWVGREFQSRHPWTRRLVRWGVRRRRLAGFASQAAGLLVRLEQALRRQKAASRVCSALFTLNYWCGISDELGGHAAVRRLLHPPTSAITPPRAAN
jgi:GT2 family glycosyltransferase